MTLIGDYNRCGEELERSLRLRTSPIAVKLLEKEEDIPAGAIRPRKDGVGRLAQCQAFALSRRQGATVAMLKEDNWCWAPLVGYGLVECPEGGDDFTEITRYIFVEDPGKAGKLFKAFPRLAHGKYIGILSAPLGAAAFVPDLVLVYSNTAQLRSLLLALKFKLGDLVTSSFDPIDSCIYSVVPVLQMGRCRITLPDPGEYERAMAGEGEIILSVPRDTVPELVRGLKALEDRKMGYVHLAMQMRPDFPQPEFYKRLFGMWGLVE